MHYLIFSCELGGEELRSELERRYGKLFSGTAICQMKEFANTCPRDYLHEIAFSVGWKHIQILNTLDNAKDWPRFAQMVQNEFLSPAALKDRIENKVMLHTQKTKSITPRLLNGKMMEVYLSLMDIGQFFHGESGEVFRNFYEPAGGIRQHQSQGEIYEPLHQISLLIDQFRLESHVQVHMAANAAYHFIGYQLYSAVDALSDSLTVDAVLFNLEERFEGKLSRQWFKGVLEEYQQELGSGLDTRRDTMTQGLHHKEVKVNLLEINPESFNDYNIYRDEKILWLLRNA